MTKGDRKGNWIVGCIAVALVSGTALGLTYHAGIDSGYRHGYSNGYGEGRGAGVNAQATMQQRLTGLGICPWAKALVVSGLCGFGSK